jgi:hypothetical protein
LLPAIHELGGRRLGTFQQLSERGPRDQDPTTDLDGRNLSAPWRGPRTLFTYPTLTGAPIATDASHINAYLVPGPDIEIGKHTRPFIPIPLLTEGNRPEDNGGLILSDDEAAELRKSDPVARKCIKQLLGARDMMRGDALVPMAQGCIAKRSAKFHGDPTATENRKCGSN